MILYKYVSFSSAVKIIKGESVGFTCLENSTRTSIVFMFNKQFATIALFGKQGLINIKHCKNY
jgi:hypothetical protein